MWHGLGSWKLEIDVTFLSDSKGWGEGRNLCVQDLLYLLKDNMNTYQLLRANWSKLSCIHVRHGKREGCCLRWGVDLWLLSSRSSVGKKEEKLFYLSCCKCRLKNCLFIFLHIGLMSYVLGENTQLKQKFMLETVAPLSAQIEVLAV